MAVASIISFTASAPSDTIIKELTQTLHPLDGSARYFVGTAVQEPTTIQITSEWPAFSTTTDLSSSSTFRSFIEVIHSLTPTPITIVITSLNKSLFAHSISPLVEYVKTDFPAQSVTPEFQKQVEADFARFESIYRKRGTADESGEGDLSVGWTEEQNNVRSFLVVRGWENMGRFEEAVQSEVFKQCIPILLEWGAPFKLVSG